MIKIELQNNFFFGTEDDTSFVGGIGISEISELSNLNVVLEFIVSGGDNKNLNVGGVGHLKESVIEMMSIHCKGTLFKSITFGGISAITDVGSSILKSFSFGSIEIDGNSFNLISAGLSGLVIDDAIIKACYTHLVIKTRNVAVGSKNYNGIA